MEELVAPLRAYAAPIAEKRVKGRTDGWMVPMFFAWRGLRPRLFRVSDWPLTFS
jgi:hypothetical protein